MAAVDYALLTCKYTVNRFFMIIYVLCASLNTVYGAAYTLTVWFTPSELLILTHYGAMAITLTCCVHCLGRNVDVKIKALDTALH